MKRPALAIAALVFLYASCARTEPRTNNSPAANNSPTNTSPTTNTSQATPAVEHSQAKPCINLNTAGERELMTLEGIGEVMARKIIEYREQNGPFRRPQDIIIIDGFSEQKYRAISDRVCVN